MVNFLDEEGVIHAKEGDKAVINCFNPDFINVDGWHVKVLQNGDWVYTVVSYRCILFVFFLF